MSDDLFLRYGRAVYEADKWCRERDAARLAIQDADALKATARQCGANDVSLTALPIPKSMVRPKPSAGPRWAGLPQNIRTGIRNGGLYSGVQAKVARTLGLNKTYIARVVQGLRVSDLVRGELEAEIERFDRAIASRPRPLTDAERKLFKRGSRYYGAIAETARDTGLHVGHIYKTFQGSQSFPALSGLRATMARRDAEIASKQEGNR